MRFITDPPLDHLTILWLHTLGTCQVSQSYVYICVAACLTIEGQTKTIDE